MRNFYTGSLPKPMVRRTMVYRPSPTLVRAIMVVALLIGLIIAALATPRATETGNVLALWLIVLGGISCILAIWVVAEMGEKRS